MRGHARPDRTAFVLAGGAARGAYEVGVMQHVMEEVARDLGHDVRLDVLCGTSVGALNACGLAAFADQGRAAIRRVVDVWTKLQVSDLVRPDTRGILNMGARLLGRGTPTDAVPVREGGLLAPEGLERIVARSIPFHRIQDNLEAHLLDALTVSTTHIRSGRTVVHVHRREPELPRWSHDPTTLARATRITAQHALASAAIPILFPPVRIGRELFMDGGVRQNTPIAPALRLGATHVFAVGLSREVRGIESGGEDQKPPGAAMVLGKVLNAFLLDHVQTDYEVLTRVNRMIEDGEGAFGQDFLHQVNKSVVHRGDLPYRRVQSLVVRPSEDIGRLAASYVRSGAMRQGGGLTRRLLSLLDVGEATEADLASYLLFDGSFAKKLIDLGRADAEARRHEIAEFFGSASEDGAPRSSESGEWQVPPPVG